MVGQYEIGYCCLFIWTYDFERIDRDYDIPVVGITGGLRNAKGLPGGLKLGTPYENPPPEIFNKLLHSSQCNWIIRDTLLRIKNLLYLCCFLWSQDISPLPSSNVCRLWRMPFHQTWQRYSRRGRSSTYHAVIILALLADWIWFFHVMMRVLHCGGVRCANGGQLHKESFWQPNHIGSCFDQDQYVFFLYFVLAQ